DGTAHTVKITIDYKDGPGNDVVQVFLDGALVATGGSWEDYYRFDPEQAGNGNKVPTTDDLLFAERGDPDPGNAGGGYLIDNIGVTSAPTPTTPVVAPPEAAEPGAWPEPPPRSARSTRRSTSRSSSSAARSTRSITDPLNGERPGLAAGPLSPIQLRRRVLLLLLLFAALLLRGLRAALLLRLLALLLR